MHKEYIFERFKDGKTVAKKEEPEFDFTPSRLLKKSKPYADFTRYDRALRQLRRYDELVQTHPAKKFVYDRQYLKNIGISSFLRLSSMSFVMRFNQASFQI